MSNSTPRFELAMVGALLLLAGFVGYRILSSPQPAPAPRGLSAADSLQIEAQYQSQLAARGSVYTVPDWLARVHIARLQAAAAERLTRGRAVELPADSVAAVLREAGDSYLAAMLTDDNNLVSRWRGERPIRVWVQPRSTVRGFSTSFVDPARRSFMAWNELHVGAQFELVDDSTQADVHVTWSAVMSKQDQVGATFRITSHPGWIVLAHVILSTTRDIYTVQNAVRHEAGHVLGLGHSPDGRDIMAAATEGRQYRITSADARTAQLLYRLPPGKISRD